MGTKKLSIRDETPGRGFQAQACGREVIRDHLVAVTTFIMMALGLPLLIAEMMKTVRAIA
jgi:hypothetical protein